MPSSSDVTSSDQTAATHYNNLRKDAMRMLCSGSSTLTIASGIITVNAQYSFYFVDTEGGASADDLDTINGGITGDVIVLAPVSAARVITLKSATGNLTGLPTDIVLKNTAQRIMLRCSGSVWCAIAQLPYFFSDFRVSGHSGFGSGAAAAASSTIVSRLQENITATSGTFFGYSGILYGAPSGPSTLTIDAVYGLAAWYSANAGTLVEGGHFEAQVQGVNLTGTLTTIRGIYAYGSGAAGITGNVTNVQAMYIGANARDLTVETLYGFYMGALVTNNGVVTTAYAGRIDAASKTGTGSFGTLYGLYLAEQTAGGTNYCLVLGGTSGNASSGLWFSTDTNLYRSAANILKTDDALTVTGLITTSAGILIADGQALGWSDVSLSRDAANLLLLSDCMKIKYGTAGDTELIAFCLADDTEVASVQTDGDFVTYASSRGPVIKDRTTGTYKRIKSTNGTLGTEDI
jgi:hypothetical protein